MNNTKSIFQKLVFIAGIFNYPIGIGIIVQALMELNPEILPIQIVFGAFIFFTGPALIWASKDLQTRAPIVVSNGIVRLCGFTSALFASTIGNIPTAILAIAGTDLIMAFIFFVGSTKYTGKSFFTLLLGKS